MFTNLLLAFDGTREGREALREAAALAGKLNAKVHLLSVVNLTAGEMMAESTVGADILEIEQNEMRKVLEEGIAELRNAGLEAAGALSQGPSAAQDIAAFARRIGADLIVLGHRDQGFLKRLWNGSVGQQLLAHTPCSVLIAVAPSATHASAAA